MRSKPKQTDESPWGYAFAGLAAIGFAAVIQFALDELPAAALNYFPIGKLALTVPLAALGVVLVLRDLFTNLLRRPAVAAQAPREKVARTQREPAPPAALPQDEDSAPSADQYDSAQFEAELAQAEDADFGSSEELDLEVGEPLEEDMGPKIPALRGRFTWLLGDEAYKPGTRREEA